MKQVKKLSLKRKPSTYGSSVLPLNLVPSKDRATPLRPTLNASNATYNRLARRKERGTVTITRSFFMNDACRMKLRSKLPSDRRLRTIYNHVPDSRSTSTGGAVQPAGLDLTQPITQRRVKHEPILLCIHDAHTTPHTQTRTHTARYPSLMENIPYPTLGGSCPPDPPGEGLRPRPARWFSARGPRPRFFTTYVEDFRGSKIL